MTDAEKVQYDVGAEKAFAAAEARNLSKIFVINKTDAENANFGNVFEALKEVHGNKLCPVVVPYIENDKIAALVNFSQNKAYKYADGKATEIDMPESDKLDAMRDMFNEAVATTSDELMEKYFEGEPFTEEEALTGLLDGVVAGDVYPVFACSSTKLEGIDLLLKGLANLGPSAACKTGETGDAGADGKTDGTDAGVAGDDKKTDEKQDDQVGSQEDGDDGQNGNGQDGNDGDDDQNGNGITLPCALPVE